MREIKPPRTSPNWSKEFECPHCGRVVEVVRPDLYYSTTPMTFDSRLQVMADCLCGKSIIIDVNSDKKDWGTLDFRLKK